MSQAKANFDFVIYDALMKNAGAGLKLILAKQLLESVTETAEHFNHPLKKDLRDATTDVEGLRAMWKAIASRVKQQAA